MHTGGFGLGTTGLPLKLSSLISDGARGVQLFYVMSAFTLFYTFSIHSRRELHRIKNFFTRRFFRIAPLFYIVIVYYFITDGWGSRYPGGASSVDVLTLLSTITFINGFHPHWINSLVPGGWSIAVEMAFYCMVPFLVACLTNLRRWAVAFAIVLAIKAISSYCLTQLIITSHPTKEWNEFLFFWLPTQFPAFMFGILLYLVVVNLGTPREDRRAEK
jgi:peptidoglycan/LPS O-acetylase OafA/YrhL